MIVFDHVSKIYPGSVVALSDVSLKIEDGEFVAVIGLSGAGKSTLLRAVNRMTDISEGKVTVGGVDVSSLRGRNLRLFRRRIGMIFQSFNLIERISVLNNVLVSFAPDLPFWRILTGTYPKEDVRKALEELDSMGILDKAFCRLDELSLGQKQRVALVRTLLQHPQIILADEPVASLDPMTARAVMEDLRKINRQRNITVMVNMHHVDLAIEFVDRIIAIRNGMIVWDGKTKDIDSSVLGAIYGGEES